MLKERILATTQATCLVLGTLLAGAWLSAQPVLDSIRPRGASPGSAATLVLEGQQLSGLPKLLASAPLTATPLTKAGPDAAGAEESIAFLIEVSSDAAPGIYPLRIETNEGISNAMLFTVDTLPVAQELESLPDSEGEASSNDFPETAQPVSFPVTVEGRLPGADRDVFSFHASEGQSLVIEVSARRLGSAIDSSIELLAHDGAVLARNGDSPGLGLDSRLAFRARYDGEHFVVVRDERYSEQKQNFYRLTLGEYEFADTVFPLGWTRGGKVRAEFSGGNLGQPAVRTVDLDGTPDHADETWIRGVGMGSSLPFLLSDREEEAEVAGGRTLRDGVVMNGRIETPGEVDRYTLAVEPGEQWSFELRSGELPGSSLYGVLTISSGGEVLAVAGKDAGDPNPYVITSTGQTATYPFVNLSIPPRTEHITVSVEDLLGRGGPGHAYRLLGRRQGPHFLLALSEPFLNIPRGGSAIVTVTAERRGYYGPIELYVADAPKDLEVSGGHIPPTSTLGNTLPRFETGVLTLSASSDAATRLLDLEVRGRSVEAGYEHLDRRAPGPGIKVVVGGVKQPPVTAEWLGYGLPVRINPEQPASLEFESPRQLRIVRGGQGLIAKWSYRARRAGVRITDPAATPRNIGSGRLRLRRIGEEPSPESGEFRIFTHERTSSGMVNFNLSTTVTAGGREHVLYSKPLEIEVADGYGLRPAGAPLQLIPGSPTAWRGEIWRDPEFGRTVTVTAVGLPVGVQCEKAQLQGRETSYELSCRAAADADRGDFEVEIRAESVLSDEGTTKYLVEPVQARLSVAD